MTLILTGVAGIAALPGISVLAALIRRQFGIHDPKSPSTSQRTFEAEILTRDGVNPFCTYLLPDGWLVRS